MLLEFLVNIVTSLILVILGLFIFFKNRKSATHLFFTALTFILASWTFTNYFSLHSDTEEITLFWIRVVMLITSFMGPALFLLLHSFPKDKLTVKKKYLIFLTFTTSLSAILAMSPFMFVSVSLEQGVKPTPGPAILVFAFNFFISVIAGFITIIRKYLKARGLEKLQIKYVFLGLIITFGFSNITNFIFVVLLKFTSFVVFGPLFNLILVVFITYAIVKHRLMDIRLIVARTVSYFLLLITLAGFYVFSIFSLSSFFYNIAASSGQIFINVVLVLIIAFGFQPLRRFLEKITDKIFFKDRYETEDLLSKLTNLLSSTLILEKLTKGVLEELLEEIKIKRGAIVLWEKGRVNEFFYQNGTEEKKFPQDEIRVLLKTPVQPVIFDELPEGRRKRILRENNFNFSHVLKVKEGIIGLLLLGEKLSGDIYSNQDVELLEIFSPQLAVAIENALAYQEIQKFSETLKLEVKKATSALEKTNKRLRQVSALKDEFVSLTSHELRTPLTAIGGSLSTVLEGYAGKVSEKTREFLEGAFSENTRLLRLVNNLLNISRIEAGRLKFNIAPLNLNEVVIAALETIKTQAEEKKLKLIFEPRENLIVQADEGKLREIIINLCGNAIKFTEVGQVAVTAWRHGEVAIVAVEDTGPGILPQDQQKLFRKFEQVDGIKASKKKGGTGLGLYICKNLIEAMGGEIWLKSEDNKGSTFYFTLPLK
ncbi:MAG TPA: ATP-binding protein [Candidatus Bathyarchaeia archaeon]|nr:ATP-binding protein [Candidatus Bathyarchaeia archaeon]